FFFQAEDGIRDGHVTGVQTCALPISQSSWPLPGLIAGRHIAPDKFVDPGFDDRALQHHTAVGPFDPAVAGWNLRLGQDDQPALRSEERRVGKECRTRWWADL